MAFVNNDNKGISDEDNSPKSEGLGHTLSGTTSAVDVSMFGESNGLADVTLVVEGRRIPVTKAVLAFSSPVFLAMFQSDFQEKEKSEIPLPDKKLQTFVHFLKCIYPNTKEQVTVKSVYEVVYLANEYQVEHLKTVCEQVLLKEVSKWEDPTSPDCCMKMFRHLVIAETCHLDKLQARCIGIASGLHWQTERQQQRSMLFQIKRRGSLIRRRLKVMK
ncbi:BAT38-like protein [Mya arenaria]|uniref:BAT38-like protein n=1 Tax=Mya arenaria TaxID=6604 RepID=A0ABY7GGU9_MYAAR|nr:speckle-type POZ protein-like isoform X3 [Mya arenaria]WAR30386.1 BAT38-like protein [Mya arenaria]